MICNSGGAPGSDLTFENKCIDKGIDVIAWSFNNHHTDSRYRKILTQEELKEGLEHVLIANETLKRKISYLSPYVKNLLSRNWFQVKNSDAVFAIGVIQKENWNIVNGGTGWATQLSIDNKKPLYVFDQEENKWYSYDYIDKIFKETSIPKLTENFAGVGTREINDNGIKAINDLLNG